ncbi:MAG: hypothetical protein V4484_09865 [Pseudomonadota bacterium]
MRYHLPSETPSSGCDVALTESALHLARSALTRWSGSAPASTPVRELPRISAQAHWLAEAQYGLAAWIARGGFAQDDEAPASAATPQATQDTPACID